MSYSITVGEASEIVERFDNYGEATEFARDRAAQQATGDAVVRVWDEAIGETVNAFQHGDTIEEAIHERAAERVRQATTSDDVFDAIRLYAADLGVMDLSEVRLDEAVARNEDWPRVADVFRAAKQRLEAIS